MSQKFCLPKLVAIIGGFMMLVGIVSLGLAVLALLGYLNVGLLFEQKYVLMLAIAMLVTGLFDVIAAVIMARW
ncbi:MAG: hypothetical protein QXH87_04865 [Candidatus Bathyarchaeia archaeon]